MKSMRKALATASSDVEKNLGKAKKKVDKAKKSWSGMSDTEKLDRAALSTAGALFGAGASTLVRGEKKDDDE